jgi:hypothetical protein
MSFDVDWIYRSLIDLSEEHTKISRELSTARLLKVAVSSILGVLTAIFLYLAFSSSTNFWQGVFVELASASGFFVAVPLFFALPKSSRKTKIIRVLLFIAVSCLAGAWFLTGFWQSVLIEAGVSFLSVAALDLVIQLWMNNLKQQIRQLEIKLAEVNSHLPQ